MSTAGITISIIGSLLGILFIVLPLILREEVEPSEDALIQAQRDYLLVYYEQVLQTIRDLDEDYETGKLTEATYLEAREQWLKNGTQILQAMDELPDLQAAEIPDKDHEALNQLIEAEIKNYLAAKAGNL